MTKDPKKAVLSKDYELDSAKMHTAAVSYAERGWPVFPIQVGGKTPLTQHGVKDATTDISQIDEWWLKKFPGANIGVATGGGANLTVLDVDERHGGYESLKKVPALPATLTSRTGGGGLHKFYLSPGFRVSNSAGKIAAGLDIRGDGGYVVVPPSMHSSGNEYAWVEPDANIALPPDWLIQSLREPTISKPAAGEELKILEGGRNDRLFKEACMLRGRGYNEDTIFAAIEKLNQEQCDPPLSQEEVHQVVLNASKHEPNGGRGQMVGGVLFKATDVGNAKWLVKIFGADIRYCPQRKAWYVWNEKYWAEDEDGEIKRRYITVVEQLKPEEFFEGHNPSAGDFKRFDEHKKQSLNRGRINAGTEVATYLKEVIVHSNDLDQDIHLLNFGNCTLELKTQQPRPHAKEDYLTKTLSYDFVPGAGCPRFLQFMDEIMKNDPAMVHYMRKIMGYCLSGSTVEECLFILHGDGANGKSTFIELCRHIYGRYAKATSFSTFVASRSERIRNDVAALVGARFVSAVEVEESKYLDEAIIKQLTGSDTISVRMLYKEFFEYKPQFKIMLSVNRLPRIKGNDEGIWRRIRVIPFEAYFREEERDPHLLGKLLEELPGILNWTLEGYKLWQQERLTNPPERVLHATSHFRRRMDSLGRFIEARGETGHEKQVVCSYFHEEYEKWCRDEGMAPLNRSEVIDAMEMKGHEQKKIRGIEHYKGVTIPSHY